MQEKTLGPDHADDAATKTSLAVLYESQSRYDEAQALLESAVAIQEKALGPDHPALATSLLPLSELYRRQGRQDDADKLFKRARNIRKSSLTEVPVFFATNRKRDPDAKSIEFGTDGESHLTRRLRKPHHLEGRPRDECWRCRPFPEEGRRGGQHHGCDATQYPASRRARRGWRDQSRATAIAVSRGL